MSERLELVRGKYNLRQIHNLVHSMDYEGIKKEYLIFLEMSKIAWASRCLLCYESYKRGIPFSQMSGDFGITRQSAWMEAKVYEHILSEAPELLDEPFLSKTFYKTVIELKIKEPIKELLAIAETRQSIWEDNVKRKEDNKELIPQLSTRRYRYKILAENSSTFCCNVCKNDIDIIGRRYLYVCPKCYKIYKINKIANQ